MNNLNLPPFYVGQRVVAVMDSIGGKIRKGQEYTIKAIKKTCCKWVVDVGSRLNTPHDIKCHKCNRAYDTNTLVHWAGSHLFAPIETTFQPITFKEVIEQELTCVN